MYIYVCMYVYTCMDVYFYKYNMCRDVCMYLAYINQFQNTQKQRKIFQHKRSVYLRQNIEEAEKDGKALWKSLNSILSPQSPTECPLTPDELLDNFVNKTAAIRHSTKDAPLPVLNSNHLNFPGLCAFDELSLPEVDKLLSDSSSKHCELDSSPVWIIKSLRHIFSPILLLLINCSLNTPPLPTSHS